MNKAILIGRLTRDPETRYTQSGTAVCTFTLAVDRRFARRDENNGQPTADFIPIVVWSKLAEVCGNNLTKGRRVGVDGRIQVRTYDAQDGTKRYVTEIVAENVEFLDSKNAAAPAGAPGFGGAPAQGGFAQPQQGGFAPQGGGMGPNLSDEDIPF